MKIAHWLMPLLVTTPVLADTTLEYSGSGAPRVIAVSGGKVMMSADAQSDVLYDASSRTLTMVNHANKTYTRMDEARMQQFATMAKQAMQNIDALMANMPPEQRAQIQAMMPGGGNRGIPQVAVKNTGRKDTVNGKSCEVWETRMNDSVESEMCVAGKDAVTVSSADMATLRQLFQATSQIAAEAGMGDMGAEWKALDGRIPLRIVEVAGGQRNTYTLQKTSSAAVPASRFAVPGGYSEQTMAMPGAAGGGL